MEKTPNAPTKAIKLLGKQVNLWSRYEWGPQPNSPAEVKLSNPISSPIVRVSEKCNCRPQKEESTKTGNCNW